jgi:hypothetical protein
MWAIKLRWCLDWHHFLSHLIGLIKKKPHELKVQINDLMECGYIKLHKPPCGLPILFMDKKDKKLRMCINYHALNKITIKLIAFYPFYNCLDGACYFSRINLKLGYY